MLGVGPTAALHSRYQPVTATTRKSGFFFYFSVAMLIVVLVGFSRTLYLRPLFENPPIPRYLYVHGVALTAWFVFGVVQTFLIRSNRVVSHRKNGLIGAFIGAVVVASTAFVPFASTSRYVPTGTNLDADVSILELGISGMPIVQLVSQVVWGNLILLLLFSVLLCAAIAFRNRAEVHKRLMLLASLSLVGPALGRIARWPALGGEGGPFVPLVFLSLVLCIIGHDLYSRRRVHAVTILGIAALVLAQIAGVAVAKSDIGQAFIRAIG